MLMRSRFGVCSLADQLEKTECGVLILPGTGQEEVKVHACERTSLLMCVKWPSGYFLGLFAVLQNWGPKENPAEWHQSQPGLRGEPLHIPGPNHKPESALHSWWLRSRSLVSSLFGSQSHLLCLLLSDVSDKERHEDGPGQAPHPDGEWTWQIWPLGVWTRHVAAPLFSKENRKCVTFLPAARGWDPNCEEKSACSVFPLIPKFPSEV